METALTPTWIASTRETLLHLAGYLRELKWTAQELAASIQAVPRGYFTASENDQIQSLLVSYWNVRGALLDLVFECRERAERPETSEEEYAIVFLPAMAAAALLVDAGRFLREVTSGRPLVRRKLNEPVPTCGVPGGLYDTVQRSLLSARHAWRLHRAIVYWEANRAALKEIAARAGMQDAFEILQSLEHRLQVRVETFAQERLRTRLDQWLRYAGRATVVRTMYGLQQFVSSMMADKYLRWGHRPQLPEAIISQLLHQIRSGDVLVVRKEHAITNYFLPGFWPHAALYLGSANELREMAVDQNEHVRQRWPHLEAPPSLPRVLESMKDGVRIRPWTSPLASDSIVVLRPQLDRSQIGSALSRALTHEGKPYDFDFDFRRSDRLVCTEVVYRAYDGLCGLNFPLVYRAGRPTLSGADLVRMAHQGHCLQVQCVYAPSFDADLRTGPAAQAIVQRALAMVVD